SESGTVTSPGTRSTKDDNCEGLAIAVNPLLGSEYVAERTGESGTEQSDIRQVAGRTSARARCWFTGASSGPFLVDPAAGRQAAPGPCDRLLGGPPAERLAVQGQLALLGLGRLQALDPHADQPDPAALQAQGVVQRAGRGVDLAGHVRGLGERPGPGDGRE